MDLQSRWAGDGSDVHALGERFILGAYVSSIIQNLTRAQSFGWARGRKLVFMSPLKMDI